MYKGLNEFNYNVSLNIIQENNEISIDNSDNSFNNNNIDTDILDILHIKKSRTPSQPSGTPVIANPI